MTNSVSNLQTRTIFHVDVNSAFLSWSALKRLKEDPGSVDLRTIPSAVGGDVQTRHGVITAKSIPAKAYGVQTGEPVVKALQKCPHLVLVRSDFTTYRAYSRQFIGILRGYTDRVQQVSIDEAFLDVTDLAREWGQGFPLNLAASIRDSVRSRLGFTVNVGISTNKFLAKMASDFEKPDKTHTLFPQEIPEKLWPLPLGELFGCGKATARRLYEMGFLSIGDVARSDPELLQGILGEKHGTYMYERANGRDDSPVKTVREDAKSYSNETTTSEDIDAGNYEETAVPIIRKLAAKVAGRLEKDHLYGSTVTVMVKTGRFRRHSRQTTLGSSTHDADLIAETALSLMRELLFSENGLFPNGEVLRLLGVGVSGLDDGSFHQMSLDEWMKQALTRTDDDSPGKQPVTDASPKMKSGPDSPSKTASDPCEPPDAEPEPNDSPGKDSFSAGPVENQVSLDKSADKRARLDEMMKKIRSRYGEGSIRKG